jgi:hypothetical protein
MSATATRIAHDLDAMLADGELDRAAYSFDDLRAAAGASAESEVTRELALLADSLARERLTAARGAMRRLVALLAGR